MTALRTDHGDVGPSAPGTPTWLRRLRLAGLVLPVVAIVVLQAARPSVAQVSGEHRADLVIGVVSAVAAVLFGVAMFTLIERGHRVIARQNQQLGEVNALLTEIARHRPLPAVVDQVTVTLRTLLRAEDAGVALVGDGDTGPEGRDGPATGAGVVAAPVGTPAGVRGRLWVRPGRPLRRDEERLLATMADLVSLSLSQQATLEQERHLARADELDRIAREMHDSLAQVLGTLHLRLRVLQDSGLPDQDASEVSELGDLCHTAYQDVREAILGLRSVAGTGEPLTTSLNRYVQHYQRHGGPPTTMETDAGVPVLPEEVQMHLLRIVQEALTNVRKHAGASRAHVRVSRVEGSAGEGVRIQVTDDGAGFDQASVPEVRRGFGLATMRERSDLIGAELEIGSRPGEGTTVAVTVPAPGAEPALGRVLQETT